MGVLGVLSCRSESSSFRRKLFLKLGTAGELWVLIRMVLVHHSIVLDWWVVLSVCPNIIHPFFMMQRVQRN